MRACPNCGKDNPADARFCNACGQGLAAETRAGETRKTVTVVFCDVAGSTALGERTDPEALRRLMTRYYDTMRSVVESHGGTVEKFIGDAIMAVFGVPRVHEDDALRAVRAASEMRAALGDLNRDLEEEFGVAILTRIGVDTGEVVAGEPSAGQNLVLGDMVNTAARLEQAAAPGEILLGEDTYRLVRDAVVVEPVDPLPLKGKSGGVPAHRLVEVRPGVEGHVRRMDSPMVGRDRQLRLLRDTFDGTVSDRACALFTVLGPAGIGKTRLVREFLDGVGGEPLVLRGRCLSYGEGITFWAVSEMVATAAGIVESDTPERAVDRIRGVLGDAHDADRIGTQLAALVGVGESPAEVEPAWAVRRLLETLATRHPVIAFFDDLHWAEPGLLDVIEHIADLAREVPILLLCTARPELLESRPGWSGGMHRATSVHLEPLDDLESEELIGNLLDHPALTPEIRQRIREAARGNPLFVEEMLSMLLDDGSIVEKDGAWVATVDLSTIQVPPAISALLAARLDRLSPDERGLLEAASVIGEIFERDAIRAIVDAEVDPIVQSLVRKDLLGPSPSDIGAGDAIRFRHILIRDAAYTGMPKERRAVQHEAFAAWLTEAAGDRAQEFDEVLGYHLEQAHMLGAELGVGDEGLAEGASFHLARAGNRARARGDMPATANLLFRAARLRPLDARRVEMLLRVIEAATETTDPDTTQAAAALAMTDLDVLEDPALRARIALAEGWARAAYDPVGEWWAELEETATEAVRILEPLGDHRGLAEAWRVLAWAQGGRAHYAAGLQAAEVSFRHARQSDDQVTLSTALTMQLGWMNWGPTPVKEAARRCDEIYELSGGNRTIEAEVYLIRGATTAMTGRFEEARVALARTVSIYEDLGQSLNVAFSAQTAWMIEWLAGDYAAAQTAMAASLDTLSRPREHSLLTLHKLMMAQAMCYTGKRGDAQEIARAESLKMQTDDLTNEPIWRRVLALAASSSGDHEEADRLNGEAVELGERTDGLFDLAWTYIERAEILRAAGRGDEAGPALE
ncbi:MAG: ATP-binding protein, partial [Actinomycetota bacterium]